MTMQEALDAYARECVRNGKAVMVAEMNHGEYEWELWEPQIKAAESAVLALYEQQKAVADELAKALEHLEGCREWDDSDDDALAHYRELEGK